MGNQTASGSTKNDNEIAEHTFPFLYNYNKQNEPFLLNLTNCKESLFNASHLTTVLIHGHNDNGNNDWIRNSRTNYFQRSSYNIIVLDWSFFARTNYFNSTINVPRVAHYMEEILVSLVKLCKLNVNDVQLIGHSLGAHLAGFIGKFVYQILNVKIGRITGLDPAGPLYGIPILVSSKRRLARGDAIFVDVIHTCGGVLGMTQFIGDADFYPNGGTNAQPGCDYLDFNCNHLRSAVYYVESIISDVHFVAYKCTSWNAFTGKDCMNHETQLMGYPVNKTAKGKYYLKTNSKYTFAQGSKSY